MSALKKLDLITVDDYLAGELVSPVKHEYLGGFVYAMAGARIAHNHIAGNIFATLHARLRGNQCRPYNSDTKIRVKVSNQVRFYYPDASIVCKSNPPNFSYQDHPVTVIEVLSRDTRRIDEGEKKDAYLTIPSLTTYVLVEQDIAAVVVHRRTAKGFEREVYAGLDAIVPLPDFNIELPLSEIYEDVAFTPANDQDEAGG
jgi:Uma2 family endonuclease